MRVSEVVQACCGAPFFFPGVEWTDKDKNVHNLVDGGVRYMNPAPLMIRRALDLGYSRENIYVLSLGSGEPDLSMGLSEAQANEALFWPLNKGLGEEMPLRQMLAAEKAAKAMVPDGNYIRMQPMLDNKDLLVGFDQADSQHFQQLGAVACKYIEENES